MYDARPIARCQDNDLIAIADLTQSSTLHMRSGKELEARLEVMSNDTDNLGNQVLLDNGQYENWMNDQLHNTDWRTFN